jgi:SAM-dependent methyltransferase
MQPGALAPYEDSLRASAPLAVVDGDGQLLEFDVARWLAPVDEVDQTVLARCVRGPVLDIGCGPGRFVAALSARGIAALGLDIADTAVALTRELGASALLRSVFDPAPAEGRWPTVLLMDGNIGIGGDPRRLLRRVRALLAADGQAVVEVSESSNDERVLSLRFSRAGSPVGPVFPWAVVGLSALTIMAAECGYVVSESWSSGGRVFATLAC